MTVDLQKISWYYYVINILLNMAIILILLMKERDWNSYKHRKKYLYN